MSGFRIIRGSSFCVITNGTDMVTLDNIQDLETLRVVGDQAYLIVSRKDAPQRYDIHSFDGKQAALWAENISTYGFFNNNYIILKITPPLFPCIKGIR